MSGVLNRTPTKGGDPSYAHCPKRLKGDPTPLGCPTETYSPLEGEKNADAW